MADRPSLRSTSPRKRSRSISSQRSKRDGYSKVKQADQTVEMTDLATTDDLMSQQVHIPIGQSGKQQMRPHEIYERTDYIPNTPLRLLEVPLNSSLTF